MEHDIRRIEISPTTRIEGHGKVIITLDEFGNVSDALFQATEIRGFELFLRGMETDRLPFIISRICGICSTAHVLASVKAIEDAYDVEVSETVKKLRELLLMAQIITNHSLVFFFLTLPDFLFKPGENPSKRNLFQIMREDPEIGKKALKLRMFGTKILKTVGGREVHITSVIPGGLIKPLSKHGRTALMREVEEATSLSVEALQLGKNLFEERWEEFETAAAVKSYYMGLVKEDELSFYDGNLHVLDPQGRLTYHFPPEEYFDHIEEKTLDWTYAEFAYLKKVGWPSGILKVSSTARMNVISTIPTPLAKRELVEFRRRFGKPVHNTLLFDYARLIELLYACERAKELLKDETITHGNVRASIKHKEGTGIGIVEAPRGTLTHKYMLTKEGKLKGINLVIPTQINNAAINVDVKRTASELIQGGKVKADLLNRVEMVVRAYDPCIKCATRSTNTAYINDLEIKDYTGRTIKTF